jgi:GAF domain
MRNPWLAIDVTTSPSARAGELRVAWQRFLDGAESLPEVRAPILESWRRSAAAIEDPSRWTAPRELSEEQAAARLAEHPLGGLMPIVRSTLGEVSREAQHLVVVSDADGLVLSVEGDPRLRAQAAERINLLAGARWSEQAAGTNAIGTALAADHAVHVFAAEHFSERLQFYSCVAAPIHEPDSGRLLGAIALGGQVETAHPHSLALIKSVASAMEANLAGTQPAVGDGRVDGHLDARPPAASERQGVSPIGSIAAQPELEGPSAERPVLALKALGRDRAHVTLDGRDLVLSQRHSEILVLLASHPAGMTGEQLALALYGDAGKPATARAEVSRLKRLLGECVQTDPYRLEATVKSDIAGVTRLLRDGRVDEAAALYSGPVLPRSEAPAVADVRNELDGWTRRAVVASDDLDALWSWLRSPSGEDDIQGWKRFLSSLPHEDGRRGLAAARLERLRPLYTVTEKPGAPVAAAYA